MNETMKKAGGIATSALLLVAAGSTAVVSVATDVAAPEVANAEEVATQDVSTDRVMVESAQGDFSWSQGTITPNSVIRQIFATASAALCDSRADFITENPLQWKLSVTGDVDNVYTVTVDELANDESVQQVMSCSCAGNPVDGRASITAEVKGIPVMTLLARAGMMEGVNTVTFMSTDGSKMSFPLDYVITHGGVLVYDVNGEDLSASMGGNNMLWLHGTSANYFARDVVEISFTAEAEAPAAPGTDMDYPNLPNASVLSSTTE